MHRRVYGHRGSIQSYRVMLWTTVHHLHSTKSLQQKAKCFFFFLNPDSSSTSHPLKPHPAGLLNLGWKSVSI